MIISVDIFRYDFVNFFIFLSETTAVLSTNEDSKWFHYIILKLENQIW